MPAPVKSHSFRYTLSHRARASQAGCSVNAVCSASRGPQLKAFLVNKSLALGGLKRSAGRRSAAVVLATLEFDDVKWVPSNVMTESATDPVGTELVYPCFPLGTHVYLPGSPHFLNIFEPRYRQMYNDILFNGSRRFVVPTCHPSNNSFAEAAVVFYLEDLKEVSQETGDQVKYQCKHLVMERVSIKRIVNPENLSDRSTYLKVVVEPIIDTDEAEDCSALEGEVADLFRNIITLQHAVGDYVHFSEDLTERVSVDRGDSGLWSTITLWQEFLQQRLVGRQQQVNQTIQTLITDYLQEQGVDLTAGMTIDVNTLPESLRNELQRVQAEYAEEVQPQLEKAIYPFQLFVQSVSHEERLDMFKEMLQEEKKRLDAKASLKSLFSE